MTARCLGPVAAKQDQMIISPPPCLTVEMRCLVFTKPGAVHYDQTSPLCLVCPNHIVPEVLCFVQMQFCK